MENEPLAPAWTWRVIGAVPAVWALPEAGWSGMIPPALTKTGMRLVGTLIVAVVGPVNVAPVK